MSNIQAVRILYNQSASTLTGRAGARQFVHLHQKVHPGPNIRLEDAENILNGHFLLSVRGEGDYNFGTRAEAEAPKLASVGAVLLPKGDRSTLPFAEQLQHIDIDETMALFCLTAYSRRLKWGQDWARDRLFEGARLLAQGSGRTRLLELEGTRGAVFSPWTLVRESPL